MLPVQPLRIKPDGTWDPIQISETLTVSSSSPFKIDLKERPDDGSVSPAPIVNNMSRVNNYPPQQGQFYVNYKNCEVFFHASASNTPVTITYYGKGSPIRAEDLNTFYTQFQDHLANHPTGGNTGDNIEVRIYTLTNEMVTSKMIYLDYVPFSRMKFLVAIPGGTTQLLDVDYTIDLDDNRKLRWDGYNLEQVLQTGDVIYVLYSKQ
jgi:hypothetical protein